MLSKELKFSSFQKKRTLKSQQILEDTIKDMLQTDKLVLDCYKIADLGCSSGPNSLLVISNIIHTIHVLCMKKKQISPKSSLRLH